MITTSLGLWGDGDDVELVMAVEKAFGIAISNEEAEHVVTVGDLYDCIRARLGPSQDSVCHSARAFYRLRRVLAYLHNCSRRAMRPSTPVADYLPRGERRRVWAKVEDLTGLRLPPLELPTWMTCTIWGLWPVMAALGILMPIAQEAPQWRIVMGALAGGIAFPVLCQVLTRPLATCLPQSCTTLGGAADDAAAFNFGRLVRSTGSWRDREAWDALTRVIGMQVGVAPERIGRQTRFL